SAIRPVEMCFFWSGTSTGAASGRRPCPVTPPAAARARRPRARRPPTRAPDAAPCRGSVLRPERFDVHAARHLLHGFVPDGLMGGARRIGGLRQRPKRAPA